MKCIYTWITLQDSSSNKVSLCNRRQWFDMYVCGSIYEPLRKNELSVKKIYLLLILICFKNILKCVDWLNTTYILYFFRRLASCFPMRLHTGREEIIHFRIEYRRMCVLCAHYYPVQQNTITLFSHAKRSPIKWKTRKSIVFWRNFSCPFTWCT